MACEPLVDILQPPTEFQQERLTIVYKTQLE